MKDRTAEIRADYEQYIMGNYGIRDTVLVRGAGVNVWDARGKKYLDFSSGIAVCNLGHCHPDVVQAMLEQAQKLIHVSNLFLNENQGKLGKIIAEKAFPGEGICFFCNSGAEANEALIKVCRKNGAATGRNEIIVMNNSFHGRTLATLAATGRSKYREGFAPDMPGFKFVPFNDFDALKKAIDKKTAGVMLEVIQGEGGVVPADFDYLKKVRDICTKKGIMLLIDEVQSGMGRTGNYFAWQTAGVAPDAFSLAKGIANGIPMGAMVCRKKFAEVMTPGSHGTTFGGTPFACAASLAVFHTIDHDKLLANCRKQGEYLKKKLTEISEKYDFVKAVRGVGLMLGVVLDFPAGQLLPLLREKGLIALSAGETVLRLVPPLIIDREDCDRALAVIDAVFAERNGAATTKTSKPAARVTRTKTTAKKTASGTGRKSSKK